MRFLNKNKGITLISLVLTIVILLILATISIVMLTGDNGILRQATKAKEETEIANEKERIELAVASAILNSNNNKLTTEGLQKELQKEFKSEYGTLSGNNGWNYIGKATYNISKSGSVVKQVSNFKIYGNNTQLPSDFQEVYWIAKSSQKNSWIDANIEIDLTSEIILEMAFMNDLLNQGYEGPVNGAININGHYSIPSTYNGIKFGNVEFWPHWHQMPNSYEMTKFTLNKKGCTINKESADVTYPYTATYASGKVYPLGSPDNLNSRGYIHSLKHYKSGSLVADLIACYRKSDGEIGMYDLITNTFFSNQGTEALMKGKTIGVGNLIATDKNNQYLLPLKIVTISEIKYISIILESPLKMKNDIADYLDFKNKKIVRYIGEDDSILENPIEDSIEIDNLPNIKDIISIEVETAIPPSRFEACE